MLTYVHVWACMWVYLKETYYFVSLHFGVYVQVQIKQVEACQWKERHDELRVCLDCSVSWESWGIIGTVDPINIMVMKRIEYMVSGVRVTNSKNLDIIYDLWNKVYIAPTADGISWGLKNLVSAIQFWDRQQWNYEKPIIENIILSGA